VTGLLYLFGVNEMKGLIGPLATVTAGLGFIVAAGIRCPHFMPICLLIAAPIAATVVTIMAIDVGYEALFKS